MFFYSHSKINSDSNSDNYKCNPTEDKNPLWRWFKLVYYRVFIKTYLNICEINLFLNYK